MSCGVGHRYGLDLVLLGLRCRLAAVVPLGPRDCENPHAMGVTIKKQKKKEKEIKKKKRQ